MKKNWLVLDIITGILLVLVSVYVVCFSIYIQGRFKFYDERIFRAESGVAGLDYSLKYIITFSLKEVFAKNKFFSTTPCNEIRNKFKEVYGAVSTVSGFGTWVNPDGETFSTNNDFFIFSFRLLRADYALNRTKLSAISHIEQCLLNGSLQ